MSRMDGFEQYNGIEDLRKYLTLAGYGGSNISLVSGYDNYGRALMLESNFTYPEQFDGGIMSIEFKIKTPGERVALFNVGHGVIIDFNDANGKLTMLGLESVIRPVTNRWYSFGLLIDKVSSTVTLQVNGRNEITAAMPSSLQGASSITLTVNGSGTNPVILDDLIIGTAILGVQSVRKFDPGTDAGVNEWYPEPSGGSHSSHVTGTPDELNRFLFGNQVESRDEFNPNGVDLPSNVTVNRIGLVALMANVGVPTLDAEVYAAGRSVKIGGISEDYGYSFVEMGGGLMTNDVVGSVMGAKVVAL